MTDEELGQKIWEHANGETSMFSQMLPSMESFGRAARAILAKPVATREAARKAIADEIGTESEYVAEKMTNALMRALSKFAPPESNAPILRMSVEEIEAEIRTIFEGWNPVAIRAVAAFVHSLAQPVPEVDADAKAREAYAKYQAGTGIKSCRWEDLYECDRNGWRAVAAVEKGNG